MFDITTTKPLFTNFSMSEWNPKRSLINRVSHWLTLPLRATKVAAIQLWMNIKEIALMLVLRFGRERNRDYEIAGRESARVIQNRIHSPFRKGERERLQENLEAERERKNFEKGSSEDAIEYRKELKKRTLDVSRGDVVNHLARINLKHRQKGSPPSKDDDQSSLESDD